MLYVTGIQALNLPCSLKTCGDWHIYGISWDKLDLKDTQQSVFKDYGIEPAKNFPFHKERYPVANHIRALLDLLDEGKFALAQGMRKDFICNESYNEEIFNKVLLLRKHKDWDKINAFLSKEYMLEWVRFIKSVK